MCVIVVLSHVPRYDLHEWLFTLHNAIEAFKKKQRKIEEHRRQPLRARANTADSITVPAPASASASDTESGRTGTPTRRAPPPPPGATGRAGYSPRRKPVRPAPVAPGTKRNRSQTQPIITPTSPTSPGGFGPSAMTLETPPPAYSDTSSSTPVHSQEGGGAMGMMESSVHPIMDLDISHTDQDVLGQGMRQHRHGMERGLHHHSVSDSLLLMHQNSASLPDLINCDGERGPGGGGMAPQGTTPGEGGGTTRQRSVSIGSGSSQSRHTRHLSLTGNEDIHAKRPPRDRKKRSSRRNGSLKLRSRSPPELPPPPPPMGKLQEDGEEPVIAGQISSETAQHNHTDLGQTPLAQYSGELPSQSSSSSFGLSEVMNAIDHDLDELSATPTKPTVPVPQRPTAGAGAKALVGEATVEFNEEEWLCDDPCETTPLSPTRPTPEGGPPSAEEESETETNLKTAQSPRQQGTFIPAEQLVDNGFLSATTVQGVGLRELSIESQSKPTRSKHRVMFKEEVEDIPNYEPRVDQEVSPTNEDEEVTLPVVIIYNMYFVL